MADAITVLFEWFDWHAWGYWAIALSAFGLLLGAAAPWFALVLSIPPPAVQADAQVLTDEGGGPPSPQARSGGRRSRRAGTSSGWGSGAGTA